MQVEVKIVKEIPEKQIDMFEDKVVYYTTIATREYVKSRHGYPRLSGKLEREEIVAPITGGNKTYNLLTGVSYAKQVYNYHNVNWTNPNTIPHWYYTAFRMKSSSLITNAFYKSLKEIKK